MGFFSKGFKKVQGYVTANEFARLTGLSLGAVQNRVKKNYIKSKVVSVDFVMIPVEEVERVKKELAEGKGYIKPGRAKKD